MLGLGGVTALFLVAMICAIWMNIIGWRIGRELQKMDWYEREYGSWLNSMAGPCDMIVGQKLPDLISEREDVLLLLKRYRVLFIRFICLSEVRGTLSLGSALCLRVWNDSHGADKGTGKVVK